MWSRGSLVMKKMGHCLTGDGVRSTPKMGGWLPGYHDIHRVTLSPSDATLNDIRIKGPYFDSLPASELLWFFTRIVYIATILVQHHWYSFWFFWSINYSQNLLLDSAAESGWFSSRINTGTVPDAAEESPWFLFRLEWMQWTHAGSCDWCRMLRVMFSIIWNAQCNCREMIAMCTFFTIWEALTSTLISFR